MMWIQRRLVIVIASVLLLLTTTQAIAQQRFNFDLDVPEGRQSFWEIGDVGAATKFATELQVHELRRDQNWYPSFIIRLGAESGAIQLRFSSKRRGNKLQAAVEEIARFANGEERLSRANEITEWSIQRDQPFKLVFDWSQQGMLVIASENQERGRYRLPFTPKALRVIASTGEIIGLSVLLGNESSPHER